MKGENNNNICYRLTALRQSLVFHKLMSLLSCASTIQQILTVQIENKCFEILINQAFASIILNKRMLKLKIAKPLIFLVKMIFKTKIIQNLPNNIYR